MLLIASPIALAQAAGSPDVPDSVPAARRLRIVALGDSTTAPAAKWAPEIREVYADCLPRSLARHGIESIVINAGIGDTTTTQAVERLDRDVRTHHPDLVVVQFGINDSWIDVDRGETQPRLSREEYRRNLETIARRLMRDGARVVLMTPNPMRWSDPLYIKAFAAHSELLDVHAVRGIDRLLDQYVADMRTVARQESLPLVDVFAAFERYGNEAGHSTGDLLLTGDGIHPNQAGQYLVCELLTARIVELAARAAAP